MTHRKGNSFEKYRALSEGMDSLFETMFGLRLPLLEAKGIWHPPTDVIETEAEYRVIIEIAGIRREDVHLSFEAGSLTVQGIRPEIDYGARHHFHIMEIDFGPFERKITLPKTVDRDTIEATYKDGLLEIRMKKRSEPPARTVSIEVES